MFVTGADKGLGYCLAEKFSAEGYAVLAGCLGDGAKFKELAARLGKAGGGSVTPVTQDVTDMVSVRASAQMVAGQVDSLDVLINCAGVGFDVGTPLTKVDLTDGSLEKMMTVNAYGPLRVTQAFLGLLEKGRDQRLVNISSEAGSIGANWRDVGFGYGMSKAALNMQSQIMQRYFKPKGIKVLVLHPGWMRTDMGGPTAHISPEEAAAAVFGLTTRPWEITDEATYLDYQGKAFPW